MNNKTAHKTSHGKAGRPKGSKAEGSILERMSKKLDDTAYIEKYEHRVAAWSASETDEDKKAALQALAETLGEIESRRKDVHDTLMTLIEASYEPPVTKGGLNLNYEPGSRIWIKPNHLEGYSSIYEENQLNNFYIDQVQGGKIAVRINNEGPAFFLPKLHLTTKEPETQEAE